MTTDTETLVEELAREICRANCLSRRGSPEDADLQSEHGWDLWAGEARAILPIIIRYGLEQREAGRLQGHEEASGRDVVKAFRTLKEQPE